MINRKINFEEVKNQIQNYPVTVLLGTKQCGKTTLAKRFKTSEYFDLENPHDLVRFDNPQLALENTKGLIVIDEIQRKPNLFPLIRYLADNNPDQKYLILGSASLDLIKQGSESLARRISFYTLSGFRKDDIIENQISQLWLRGGLPLSFLAESDKQSNQWRLDYITSFLERDIPGLGIRIPPETLQRFWQMISHYHGGIVNFSELGQAFGVADTTIRHYMDILKGTFMIRLLSAWYVNAGKRLVKRPKLYIRDSGILHTLLSIESEKALHSHPKLGASWEGFALECVLQSIRKADEQIFFWRTHSGAEVDLFWQHDGKNYASEFKYLDAPELTRSMKSALDSLGLEKLWVIYPGKKKYLIHEKVIVLPLSNVEANWNYN